MRRGLQRYSRDFIQTALQKLDNGTGLSDLARELDLSKSTLKYWMDHRDKFLGDGKGLRSAISKNHERYLRESWKLRFKTLKAIEGQIEGASLQNLIKLLTELREGQTQIGPLPASGKPGVGQAVVEKRAEISLTVSEFLSKKLKGDLSAAPPEPTGGAAESAAPAGPATSEGGENSAT
jgi:transposase-like protein